MYKRSSRALHDTPTRLRKQLLRTAIREVIVRRDGGQLIINVHWAGEIRTELCLAKRATPVGSRTDASLSELVRMLAETLDDGEIARILNMKKLSTPHDLRWTKDRVHDFRAHHRIKHASAPPSPDVLTGEQTREALGIGYNGLMALIRRGVLHTNQVTDFAPFRIPRAELGSEQLQALVATLKATGRLPSTGGSPQTQRLLFAEKSTAPRKCVL